MNALSRFVFNDKGIPLYERLHVASFWAWFGVKPGVSRRDVGDDGNPAFLGDGRHFSRDVVGVEGRKC